MLQAHSTMKRRNDNAQMRKEDVEALEQAGEDDQGGSGRGFDRADPETLKKRRILKAAR
jgi:hypothetical protein